MPIYLFRCDTCGYECDERLAIADRDNTILAPQCGHGTGEHYDYMTRVPAPSNFTLKGKGWARDGYASKD